MKCLCWGKRVLCLSGLTDGDAAFIQASCPDCCPNCCPAQVQARNLVQSLTGLVPSLRMTKWRKKGPQHSMRRCTPWLPVSQKCFVGTCCPVTMLHLSTLDRLHYSTWHCMSDHQGCPVQNTKELWHIRTATMSHTEAALGQSALNWC
jgi:hypothetical protein